MSNRVLCKFFAHGACLKGEHCEYSHDWKDPSSNICTYYQKGNCSYGSRCRYDHVKASRPQSAASSSTIALSENARIGPYGVSTVHGLPSELSPGSRPFLPSDHPAWRLESRESQLFEPDVTVELESLKPSDRPLCSYAAAGNCPRGDQCPHIHGDLCPSCGKHCLHPLRPEEREEHMKTCEKMQKHLDALKHSQEIECCVCLDKVLLKPGATERKFGVLSECDHPFCIGCIRNWRSSLPSSGVEPSSMSRTCPVCRKLSYFVVPSVIWYFSQEEKTKIIDNYKAKLSSIDCKHFNFGNGNCPFGSSCFYKENVRFTTPLMDAMFCCVPASCQAWHVCVETSQTTSTEALSSQLQCCGFSAFYPQRRAEEDVGDPWDPEFLYYDEFCDPFDREYLNDEDFPFLDDKDNLSPFPNGFITNRA